nr:hypothetical protein CFP56_38159 [Quercus suber]
MACGACKNMKKGCKNDCPFREYFGPQDATKFKKLKCQYKPKVIGEMLSDPNTTKEDKERRLQEWYACVNGKGEEKQAGLSSSNNKKKELQASKCQAASTSKMEVIAEKKGVQASSSNELGCNDTCFFAALFSPEEKHKMVEIKNELGMEIVETEKQIMLEKLFTKADELQEVAQIMLETKNMGDQQ